MFHYLVYYFEQFLTTLKLMLKISCRVQLFILLVFFCIPPYKIIILLRIEWPINGSFLQIGIPKVLKEQENKSLTVRPHDRWSMIQYESWIDKIFKWVLMNQTKLQKMDAFIRSMTSCQMVPQPPPLLCGNVQWSNIKYGAISYR